MALFVFFHSFLELHILKHCMASNGGDDETFCGSIKLWEDMERVNQNSGSDMITSINILNCTGGASIKAVGSTG